MIRKIVSAALGAALLSLGLAGPSFASSVHTSADAVPGQYIVVLKISSAHAKNVTRTNRILATYRHALNGVLVRASSREAARMSTDSRVAGVYQDAYAHAVGDQPITPPPNSPWGLDRIDQRALPLSGHYTYTSTGLGVNAYIIDTGIQTTHNQFEGRADFPFAATGIGGGKADCMGHGTHVAGIVGGKTYGVAKQVSLHAVKVLDCTGSGSYGQVIEGVDWVTAHAVKPAVANMSLGGPTSRPLDQAVSNSIASGITYSVAAGNSNRDACQSSPARVANALTVGASGDYEGSNPVSDMRAVFSNYGKCLDIFAPGVDIMSSWTGTDAGSGDGPLSGTSMASPHVAGAVAKYLQTHTSASPATVRSAITGAATTGVVTSAGRGSPNLLLFSN